MSLVELFPPDDSPADYLGPGRRAFRLEVPAIREFASVETRSLIWSWPTFTVDVDGMTEGWTPKSGQRTGGKNSGQTRKAEADMKAAKAEAILATYMCQTKRDELALSEAAEVCNAFGLSVVPNTLKKYVGDSSLLKTDNPNPRRCVITMNDLPIPGA